MLRLFFKISACTALALTLAACDHMLWNRSEPLAKVGTKALYISDVQEIFPKNISAEDSIAMLRSYVDTWVKKELLLKLAEENLDSKQKDVQALLEDYRTSLLVYRYEQNFIEQIDTSVTSKEIENFYKLNKQHFTLNKPLVRVLFIKLKKNSPYLDRIKKLYTSTKPEDITTLEGLCLQAALKFDYYGDRWLGLDEIAKELPAGKNYEEMVKQNRAIEVTDATYAYMVAIRDYRARGLQSPMEYERDNIKTMILNRRKQSMIKDFEQRALQNARQQNTVKIFIDE